MTLLLAPSFSHADQGRFEVVRESCDSPASLYDFTVVTDARGKEVLISTYRRDSFLLRIDLESGEVARCNTPGFGYALVGTRRGRVFVGTGVSPGAKLFEYHVDGGKLEEIATIENEEALYWLEEAPDGSLYGGTYPGTLLIRFDPESRRLTNLGPMSEGQTHNLLGAVSPGGRVYSGIGMQRQAVIEYDPATGTRRNIWPKAWETTNLARVYLGEDGNVYCYPGIPTESSKGKSLRVTPQGEVSITTEAVRQAMGRTPQSRVSRPTLKDGTTLDRVEPERVVLTRPDGTSREIRFEASGGRKEIYSIGTGPGGTIFGTSKPLVVFGYDPATGRPIDFPRRKMPGEGMGGQVDALCSVGDALFFGTYTHARLYRMDLRKDEVKTSALGELGGEQDRIHAMLPTAGGEIYLGTISAYGLPGGALARLDPRTGERRVFRDALPGQSVVVLAQGEEEGRLYLGGSIHGGTGSEPAASGERSAAVGEWDLQHRRLLRGVVPIAGEARINGLVVLPEVICGLTSTGKWFVLDRETMKVLSSTPLHLGVPTQLGRLAYHAGTGMIYGLLGDKIIASSATDPQRVSVAAVVPDAEGASLCGPVCDAAGNLYFGRGREMLRWTPPERPQPPSPQK
ncbi:MAG TPA: hypothetical protein VNQ90_07780 [Chthoniobacteraceae bacterium]|nr:hypothetical protein [Chthoniobacteraceae bacterium]